MENRIVSYFDDPTNSDNEIAVELDFTTSNFEIVASVDPEISLESYLSFLADERLPYTLNPNPKKKPHIH